MRTFVVTDTDGASHTIPAETMELTDGMLVFRNTDVISAAFARWTAVIEQGAATTAPAPPPLAEPAAVTELRESLRDRGATV